MNTNILTQNTNNDFNIKDLQKKFGNDIIKMEYARALYAKQLLMKYNPIAYFIPYEHQMYFHLSTKRNKVVLGGNRSGKTINGAKYVVQKCLDNPGFDVWCSTWAGLSVPVQQTKINEFLPKNGTVHYAQFSPQRGFSNRIVIFENGSVIRFKTYEEGWERFQGASKDLIWNDEEAPEDIIKEQRARLIDRNGELIRTMTPLNGLTYTYDEIILNTNKNPETEYWLWNTKDNKSLEGSVIDAVMSTYSDKEANVRTTGQFDNLTSGLMYYPFTEENIVEESPFGVEVFPNIPIEVSCDFNVNFMNWNLGQCINDIDYEFDNVCLENKADTGALCQMIKAKYAYHPGGFIFYGDIAGKHGSTVTSETDWSIIQKEFPEANVYYQNIQNVGDRVSAFNGRICNAKGERKVFVKRKGNENLINDLRRLTWEIFLSESQRKKNPKLTHPTDGASYKYFWKYPQYGTNKLTRRKL